MFVDRTMPRIYKPRIADVALNRAHPLARGLILAALFEGGIGYDFVNNFGSTPTGGISQGSGPIPGVGTGMFNSNNSGTMYHSFSQTSQFDLHGAISIVVRGIDTAADFSTYHMLATQEVSNGGSTSAFEFRIEASSGQLRINGGQGGPQFSPAVTLGVVQTWGVTSTGSGGTAVGYINGGSLGSATDGSRQSAVTKPVIIGGRDAADLGFNGTIFHAFIWTRVLSTPEMLWVHQEPYAFLKPKNNLVSNTAAAAGGTKFRRTLSALGTRSGSRQMAA